MAITRLSREERARVRTITFQTPDGIPGTVTGIPALRTIHMISAGCKTGRIFVIPPEATILEIQR